MKYKNTYEILIICIMCVFLSTSCLKSDGGDVADDPETTDTPVAALEASPAYTLSMDVANIMGELEGVFKSVSASESEEDTTLSEEDTTLKVCLTTMPSEGGNGFNLGVDQTGISIALFNLIFSMADDTASDNPILTTVNIDDDIIGNALDIASMFISELEGDTSVLQGALEKIANQFFSKFSCVGGLSCKDLTGEFELNCALASFNIKDELAKIDFTEAELELVKQMTNMELDNPPDITIPAVEQIVLVTATPDECTMEGYTDLVGKFGGGGDSCQNYVSKDSGCQSVESQETCSNSYTDSSEEGDMSLIACYWNEVEEEGKSLGCHSSGQACGGGEGKN